MKLALGTVQFGLDYGVSNASGRPTEAVVGAILARARDAGVHVLDTAVGYGDAEERLGALGVGRPEAGWSIITKLPGLPSHLSDSDVRPWCRAQLIGSLARLNRPSIDGLLLHRPLDLLGERGAALLGALRDLRDQGLVRAVGVSIYGPEELQSLAQSYALDELPLDIVQVPCNVLDRRFERSGWAETLARRGTRVHLRSAFLQGLLLMPPDDAPAHLLRRGNALAAWHAWLRDTGSDALSAALRFATSRPFAERVVVGVVSATQLDGILRALDDTGPLPPDALEDVAGHVIDPRTWSTNESHAPNAQA